ncbi:hypothetical protein [Streptomyces iakyrus]|uniref:hypothetical protein n=1 Tax=Streptomyces iakyrus TaxID=68219 RepID=UPI003D93F65D
MLEIRFKIFFVGGGGSRPKRVRAEGFRPREVVEMPLWVLVLALCGGLVFGMLRVTGASPAEAASVAIAAMTLAAMLLERR